MAEISVVDFLTGPDRTADFTFSYPAPADFPALLGKSAYLLGILWECTEQRVTPDGQKTVVRLRKTTSRGASGTWEDAPEIAGQTVLLAPALDRAPVPATDPVAAGTPGGRTTMVAEPTGVPLLAIGAVIAALAGLGVIYLIVDKVEEIVESPGVNVALVAVSVIAVAFLYRAWQTRGAA